MTDAQYYQGWFGCVESDADVLRAWRAKCPELRELWDESEPVTAWQGVTLGEAGGEDVGRQELTLVHLSAQRKRFLVARGCVEGLFRESLGGVRECWGVFRV